MIKLILVLLFVSVFIGLGWQYIPNSLLEKIGLSDKSSEKKEEKASDFLKRLKLPEDAGARKEAIAKELRRNIQELRRRFSESSDESVFASSENLLLPVEIKDIAKIPTSALFAAADTLLGELAKEGRDSSIAKNTAEKILGAVLPSGLFCP